MQVLLWLIQELTRHHHLRHHYLLTTEQEEDFCYVYIFFPDQTVGVRVFPLSPSFPHQRRPNAWITVLHLSPPRPLTAPRRFGPESIRQFWFCSPSALPPRKSKLVRHCLKRPLGHRSPWRDTRFYRSTGSRQRSCHSLLASQMVARCPLCFAAKVFNLSERAQGAHYERLSHERHKTVGQMACKAAMTDLVRPISLQRQFLLRTPMTTSSVHVNTLFCDQHLQSLQV